MRKISTFCRFPGNLYQANFADLIMQIALLSITAIPLQTLAGDIELPPPPTAAPPPALPQNREPAVIRKIERDERKANEKMKIEAAQENQAKKVLAEKIKSEAQQKRPLYGFFELSLLYPKVSVSRKRTDYHCDVTSHINGYLRLFVDKDPETVQGWAGLRVASFGGYGIQNNFSGRFAHTFLGPSIGIGGISKPDDPLNDIPTRTFWLWSGGIAAVSKLNSRDDGVKQAPSDFKSTGWGYEAPGLWSELRWSKITRGALGYGGVIGLQLAEGKNFFYAGISGSGFY